MTRPKFSFRALNINQYLEIEKTISAINYVFLASGKSIKGSLEAIPKEIWISQAPKPDYNFGKRRISINTGFYIFPDDKHNKLSVEISLSDWDKVTVMRDECNKKYIITLKKGDKVCEYAPDIKDKLVVMIHCGVLIPPQSNK